MASFNSVYSKWNLTIHASFTFFLAGRSKTVSVHWRQGTAETRFHNTTTSIRRPAAAVVANLNFQHPPLTPRNSLLVTGNTKPPVVSIQPSNEFVNGILVSKDCHVVKEADT